MLDCFNFYTQYYFDAWEKFWEYIHTCLMNLLEIVKSTNSIKQRASSKDTQDHWPLACALLTYSNWEGILISVVALEVVWTVAVKLGHWKWSKV